MTVLCLRPKSRAVQRHTCATRAPLAASAALASSSPLATHASCDRSFGDDYLFNDNINRYSATNATCPTGPANTASTTQTPNVAWR